MSETLANPGSGTPGALPFACDKAITFTSTTVGWASSYCNGGTPFLYRSTDGGATWSAVGTVPLPAGAPAPEGEGLGTPVVAGSEVAVPMEISGKPGAAAIATSSDDGASWVSQLVPATNPPVGSQVGSVDLIDPAHWLITNGSVLMATNDAGTHWKSWTAPVDMTGTLGATDTLDFISPLVGWAVPGVNGGPMWMTVDGGRTWKPVVIEAGPYLVPAS